MSFLLLLRNAKAKKPINLKNNGFLHGLIGFLNRNDCGNSSIAGLRTVAHAQRFDGVLVKLLQNQPSFASTFEYRPALIDGLSQAVHEGKVHDEEIAHDDTERQHDGVIDGLEVGGNEISNRAKHDQYTRHRKEW